MAELDMPPRRRRRIRQPNASPIAEVVGRRSVRGRNFIEEFDAPEQDLDIELLEELESEITMLTAPDPEPATPKASKPRTPKATKPTVQTAAEQAEEMFTKLFGTVPNTDAVNDAKTLWLAATANFIRTVD